MLSGSVTAKYLGSRLPRKREKDFSLSLSPTPIQLLTPTQISTPIHCLTLISTPVLILTVGPTPVPCVTLASTPFMSASCSNSNSACENGHSSRSVSPSPFECLIPVPTPSLIPPSTPSTFLCLTLTPTPILSLTRPPTTSLTPAPVLTYSLISKPAPPPCLILTVDPWENPKY